MMQVSPKFTRTLISLAFMVGAALFLAKAPEGPDAWASAATGKSGEGKPITKDDLPAAKAKLAELEKTLAAKEKELDALKSAAALLRKQIAAVEAPDKVYRTPQELLADMPKDAYPKSGSAGGIERAAARKWLKENVVGRTIEWTATVKSATVIGDGPFTVTLLLSDSPIRVLVRSTGSAFVEEAAPFGEEFNLGGESCQVALQWGGFAVNRIDYLKCSAEEAKALRELKGKVTLRATVVADEAAMRGARTIVAERREAKTIEQAVIVCATTTPSANGILPAASRPKADVGGRGRMP